MRGLHLTADLYQCRCDTRWLADPRALGPWCRDAAEAAGLHVGQAVCAEAAPGGSVDVALLLPGSHVCLHTWPDERSASIDVCLAHSGGDLSAEAHGLLDALLQRLQPEWTEQRSLDRGDDQ